MPRTTSRSEIVTWKKSASEQARGLDLDHIFVNLHTKLKQKMSSDRLQTDFMTLGNTMAFLGCFRAYGLLSISGCSPSRVQHPKGNYPILFRFRVKIII